MVMLEPVFRELLKQSGVKIESLDRDDEGLFATGHFDGPVKLLERRIGDAIHLRCEEQAEGVTVHARPPDSE